MPELRIEVQPITKFNIKDQGEEREVNGCTDVDIFCEDLRLFCWSVRPRHPWWGGAVHQSAAIVVGPCYEMMNNRILKHYKYDFTMGLIQGYKLLLRMEIPTYEFERAVYEQGWGEILDAFKVYLLEPADE